MLMPFSMNAVCLTDNVCRLSATQGRVSAACRGLRRLKAPPAAFKWRETRRSSLLSPLLSAACHHTATARTTLATLAPLTPLSHFTGRLHAHLSLIAATSLPLPATPLAHYHHRSPAHALHAPAAVISDCAGFAAGRHTQRVLTGAVITGHAMPPRCRGVAMYDNDIRCSNVGMRESSMSAMISLIDD